MAYTVAQLITDIQESYTDCTDAKALRLINSAIGAFSQEVDSVANTETNTSVVADTHTYTLSKQYGKILDCTWATSATTAKSLIPWSPEQLDSFLRGLRSIDTSSGTPTHYIVEPAYTTLGTQPVVLKIRFYPVPDTSTDTGYPYFSVTGTAYVALASDGSLPNYILDPEWVKQDVCFRLALEAQKLDEAEFRRNLAYDLRSRQARALQSIQARTCQHLDFPLSGGDRTF